MRQADDLPRTRGRSPGQLIRGWLFPLAVLWLAACATYPQTEIATVVDLDHRIPLPPLEGTAVRPLRVAIAAVISPKSSAESYASLLDYLGQRMDRPVEAIQRRTYHEVNEMIRSGEVDLAFVCTSSYLIGRRDFGMQLVAAPQVNGKAVYWASIVVPASSVATEVADLRGAVFAFTDPLSLTGRAYPAYLLAQMGEDPETFFQRTFFTYSHDDAIRAVASGLADGASVDKLVLDFALKRDPELGSRVRVIHTSPPFGIPPVVVGPQARPQVKAEIAEILLSMHLDPAGQAALRDLDYDRFVLLTPEDYASAAEIELAVRELAEGGP